MESVPIYLTDEQVAIFQSVSDDGKKRTIDITQSNFTSSDSSVFVSLPFSKTGVSALKRELKKGNVYPYSVTKTTIDKLSGEGILDSIISFGKKAAPHVKKAIETIKPIAEQVIKHFTKPKVREYVSPHIQEGLPSSQLPPPPDVVGNATKVYFQNGKWYMEGGALKHPVELPANTAIVFDHQRPGGLLILPGSSLNLPGAGEFTDEGGFLYRPGDKIIPTSAISYKVIPPQKSQESDQKKATVPISKVGLVGASLSLKFSEDKNFHNYDLSLPDSIKLPDKALSSFDISEFINHFPKLRKIYAGTFARDQLIHENPDVHDAFIINTAPTNSDLSMGHWQIWLGIESLASGAGIYEMLGSIAKIVGKLRRDPDRGLTVPGDNYYYLGPFNSMKPSYIAAHPPENQSAVDQIAYRHDVQYAIANKTPDKQKREEIYHNADKKMIEELDALTPTTILDKIYKPLARFAIATKYWVEGGDKGANDYEPPKPEKPELSPPEEEQLKQLYTQNGGALEELIEKTDYKVDDFNEYEEVIDIMRDQKLQLGQFFDSYGIEGIPEELGQLLSKEYPGPGSKLRVFFNNEQYQDMASYLCGHYCLFVLYAIYEKGFSYYEVTKLLSENTPADKYIRKWCHI